MLSLWILTLKGVYPLPSEDVESGASEQILAMKEIFCAYAVGNSPGLLDEKSECSVEFEFQLNYNFFSLSISQLIFLV